jgi:hypothetical protein
MKREKEEEGSVEKMEKEKRARYKCVLLCLIRRHAMKAGLA